MCEDALSVESLPAEARSEYGRKRRDGGECPYRSPWGVPRSEKYEYISMHTVAGVIHRHATFEHASAIGTRTF